MCISTPTCVPGEALAGASSFFRSDVHVFPCSNHPGENHQEPIYLRASRSFDLPRENDELLLEEGAFYHKFGRASDKVSPRSPMREGLDVLVQTTKLCWSDSKHMRINRLMKVPIPCRVYASFVEEERVYAF
jgi:hypothetical protein